MFCAVRKYQELITKYSRFCYELFIHSENKLTLFIPTTLKTVKQLVSPDYNADTVPVRRLRRAS